jgi:hypothetical protein
MPAQIPKMGTEASATAPSRRSKAPSGCAAHGAFEPLRTTAELPSASVTSR